MNDDALYHPIDADLPRFYRRSEESWQQVRAFLEMVDDVARGYVDQLQDLPHWLSPDAMGALPPGAASAGTDASTTAARRGVLEELLRANGAERSLWRGLDLECGAGADPGRSNRLKAALLRRLPRLMRDRGTPLGLLRLLCACFGLVDTDPEQCPILIEHFAYEVDACDETTADNGARRHRVTLFVRQIGAFEQWPGVHTLQHWIQRYAPAHLILETFFVSDAFWPEFRDLRVPTCPTVAGLVAESRDRITTVDEWMLRASEEGLPDESERASGPRSELNVRRVAHRDDRGGQCERCQDDE
ncbi:MAG: hypothetical protein ACE37K_03760 [Planctomycetota bacterium]